MNTITHEVLPGDAGTLRGNFVMLRAGGLRLVLAQRDVGAAEYLATRPRAGDEPGKLRLEDASDGRVFAALSEDMTMLAECPAGRFIVAALGADDHSIAWCWDELRVLIDVELQPRALPEALLTPLTPVDFYVEVAGEFAYLYSAERLCEFALTAGVMA